MTQIHEKIIHLMHDRGVTYRQAASLCAINFRTFHSALTEKRKISTDFLEAICAGFEVDFAYFSPNRPLNRLTSESIEKEHIESAIRTLTEKMHKEIREAMYAGTHVSLSDFLNWWASNGGRMEDFDKIAPRVDTFKVPTPKTRHILPTNTGQSSLATKHFGVSNKDQLVKTLQGFSARCNEDLIAAHLEAVQRGEPVITHPVLDERLPDGRRFQRQYRRVLAPVTLPDGSQMLLNYSEDII